MKVEKYSYKLVLNTNSIELYEYDNENNYIKEDETKPDKIENRVSFGNQRETKKLKIPLLDDETGELTYKQITESSSLEEKLEYGIYSPSEYNERKLKALKFSRSRSITELRRKIDNNLFAWEERPKFITLTYDYQLEDREKAYNDFKKFIKRLNYRVASVQKDFDNISKQWLKWVAVLEHQKSGRIHFHTIFFNLPFVRPEVFKKCWTYGIFDIKTVDVSKGIRKLIGYLTKYIIKEQIEDNEKSIQSGRSVAEKKKRFYLSSNGLKKQKEILIKKDEEKEIKKYIRDFDLQFETKFKNEHSGTVHYKQFYKN